MYKDLLIEEIMQSMCGINKFYSGFPSVRVLIISYIVIK